MASIDYQEAKKEITKLFRTKDCGRKVIFWYDPPMNFKEDILSDSYDCCQVLLCDKNEFFIKKTIEHDEPDKDFLAAGAERSGSAESCGALLQILR